MKKTSLLVITLSSIFLSSFSYANHHESGDGAKCHDMSKANFSISHFDSDKDGNISLQEYLSGDAANTEKTYKHLDANSDGMLDNQEQREIEAVYKTIHDQYKAKNTSI
ncbi:MAG: hypothetical protein B7Y16_04775 [Methylotenera sp. 24-45-7]|jgi:hypothetical protein|nr:MAG: hypothetical protein B7Y72_00425 [Mehylophilales bacterium 35-46-6]OYZ40752.1 MAG: hypothetical protein B7Y16_04775 [Methylotenera sp. 24-45-7]OZA53684.1 MAG: hypothetical protein B7X73_03505 [Methylophilales bacterium 39-45-7]HQS37301.1 hypothetical protein [Methylotenera sp.]HQS43912.1 hypothetical protein [Methylotenera sp.]